MIFVRFLREQEIEENQQKATQHFRIVSFLFILLHEVCRFFLFVFAYMQRKCATTTAITIKFKNSYSLVFHFMVSGVCICVCVCMHACVRASLLDFIYDLCSCFLLPWSSQLLTRFSYKEFVNFLINTFVLVFFLVFKKNLFQKNY